MTYNIGSDSVIIKPDRSDRVIVTLKFHKR